MTERVEEKRYPICKRAQGKRVLELWRAGPFIEVTLDDIIIGKVRKKKKLMSTVECDCEECLVLHDYVIELTDEESMLINAEFQFHKK